MPSSHSASAPLPNAATLEWLTLDTVTAAPLKAGVAWWRLARGDRPYPTRQDLRPRDMTGLMPYMSLLKVIDCGADFEHRIVGDMIVQSFKITVQNRRFSEIANDAPDFTARCFSLFRMVVETGAPLAWHSRTTLGSAHIVITFSEVVLLPLGRNGVDHVLCFGGHRPDTFPRFGA